MQKKTRNPMFSRRKPSVYRTENSQNELVFDSYLKEVILEVARKTI